MPHRATQRTRRAVALIHGSYQARFFRVSGHHACSILPQHFSHFGSGRTLIIDDFHYSRQMPQHDEAQRATRRDIETSLTPTQQSQRN
jgi:hypothetical protein